MTRKSTTGNHASAQDDTPIKAKSFYNRPLFLPLIVAAISTLTAIVLMALFGGEEPDVEGAGINGSRAEPLPASVASNWSPVCSEDGWCWQHPLPQGTNLNAVWGSDSNNIFAVGSQGIIMHYDGQEWTRQESGTEAELMAIQGASARDIVAVGAQGTFLRYNGTAWSKIAIDSGEDLLALWYGGPHDIIAAGGGGTVVIYNGVNWRVENVGTLGRMGYVDRDSSRNIRVIDARGRIYTSVGFDNWQVRNSAGQTNPGFQAVKQCGNRLLAIGGESEIWSYSNQGEWTSNRYQDFIDIDAEYLPDHQNITNLWCFDDGEMFINASTALLHYDGSEWHAQMFVPSDPGIVARWTNDGNIHGMWRAENGVTYAVGENGAAYRFRDGRWAELAHGVTDRGTFRIHGVRSNQGVHVYTVDGSTVHHYDGQTRNVEDTHLNRFVELNDVWVASPDNVFVVGGGGTLAHKTENGWTRVRVPTGTHLNAIWGTDPENIWVVGNNDTVLHFDGQQWSSLSTGLGGNIHEIWGTSPLDIFAIAIARQGATRDHSRIVHFDGENWSVSYSNENNYSLRVIWGANSENVYVVGGRNGSSSRSVVLHYDGSSWSERWQIEGTYRHTIFINASIAPQSIWGHGENDIYLGLSSGNVLHYDGSTWSEMVTRCSSPIEGIWGVSSDTMFVVGSHGEVLNLDRSAARRSERRATPYVVEVTPEIASDADAGVASGHGDGGTGGDITL